MPASSAISEVAGRAVVLPCADIDTDRIMPARFLKAITFEGLEQHLFADDRAAATREGRRHPLDDASAKGARILVTEANFGCGSSREHAPQALARWGFRAIIAESFSPIFAGNALSIGLVCATVTPADLAIVMAMIAATPDTRLEISLDSRMLRVEAGPAWPLMLRDDHRHALLSGQWDGTGLLLDNYAEVARVEARLPYLRTTARNA
jgi:3-isopropylmalate/(R)-2-methylmalate dehydratase small subunit